MSSSALSAPLVDRPTSPPVGLSARLRLVRLTLGVCGVGAVVSGATSLWTIASTDSASRMVLTWQGYGYLVFAGLFVVLLRRPLAVRGLWELVLFHKFALTVTASFYAIGHLAEGVGSVLIFDGALCALLAAGYVACRGWTATGGRTATGR